jgi:hypothetical protein
MPDGELYREFRVHQIVEAAREFIAAIFEEEERYANEPRGY